MLILTTKGKTVGKPRSRSKDQFEASEYWIGSVATSYLVRRRKRVEN
jgi:hypothetical protein